MYVLKFCVNFSPLKSHGVLKPYSEQSGNCLFDLTETLPRIVFFLDRELNYYDWHVTTRSGLTPGSVFTRVYVLFPLVPNEIYVPVSRFAEQILAHQHCWNLASTTTTILHGQTLYQCRQPQKNERFGFERVSTLLGVANASSPAVMGGVIDLSLGSASWQPYLVEVVSDCCHLYVIPV